MNNHLLENTGLEQTGLEQLRPIILPEDNIGIWPLAPGWWILCAIILLVVAGYLFFRPRLKSYRRKKLIWKNTQQLLDDLYLQCRNEKDLPLALQLYLQKSNDIFKRVIHTNPHLSRFAHLTGKEWTAFMASVAPKPEFAKLYGDNLYAPRCTEKISMDELHHWATEWLVMANKNARDIGKKNELAP